MDFLRMGFCAGGVSLRKYLGSFLLDLNTTFVKPSATFAGPMGAGRMLNPFAYFGSALHARRRYRHA
jgi:hypothetical protein